jgi:hypothetical protein
VFCSCYLLSDESVLLVINGLDHLLVGMQEKFQTVKERQVGIFRCEMIDMNITHVFAFRFEC